MRHRLFAACSILLLGLSLPGAAARAEEKRPFQFGLESRFSDASGGPRHDLDWDLIPGFSYHLSDRFRLDGFAGVAYSELDGLVLSVNPGFRYYLTPAERRLRFNTGLSVGFTLIGREQRVATTDAAGNPLFLRRDDDDVWLRLVPLEAEYWGSKRWGMTMAIDFQDRFDGDGTGFGLAAGLRYKIR